MYMEFRKSRTNSNGIARFEKVGVLDVLGDSTCIQFVFLIGDSGNSFCFLKT